MLGALPRCCLNVFIQDLLQIELTAAEPEWLQQPVHSEADVSEVVGMKELLEDFPLAMVCCCCCCLLLNPEQVEQASAQLEQFVAEGAKEIQLWLPDGQGLSSGFVWRDL